MTYFIIEQLQAIESALKAFHSYLDREVHEQTHLRAAFARTLNNRQVALLEHIKRHNHYVYTAQEHASWHSISLNTARTDLEELADRGFLSEKTIHRIHTYTATEKAITLVMG